MCFYAYCILNTRYEMNHFSPDNAYAGSKSTLGFFWPSSPSPKKKHRLASLLHYSARRRNSGHLQQSAVLTLL